MSKAFAKKIETFLPIIAVSSFLCGIVTAMLSPGFSSLLGSFVQILIEGYVYIAPAAIFLILTPSLAKLFKTSRGGRFSVYAITWLAARKFASCIWAVIFTALIFKLPMLPPEAPTIGKAFSSFFVSFGKTLTKSPYFIAVWLSIIVTVISLRLERLYLFLDRAAKAIEDAGQYFEFFIPIFMFVVGAYIYSIPATLAKKVSSHSDVFNNPWAVLKVYLIGSGLVALGCFIWHLLLLFVTRYKIKDFSILDYFKKYWIKVYPLLWSTSSEALATPLNLFLVKKHFPQIANRVRRFVVGMGSYLNINGTIICVFVLAGLISNILGYRPSILQMALSIPVVFLLSYGVPGIPGELVIFAGPLAVLLGIPEPIYPTFLALYIGLQVGLPDSFRTGNNTTDDCVSAIYLGDVYNKRFKEEEKESLREEDE